ncbi:GTP pyrophosphokinase [Morganella morganii]|uniref:GTP pyrophosphokinase n=1 Tax=Morganella morganii TaxID=582 RepID=UPI0024B939D7|nr:GTP pyrophosphokinase [Morganella morganii]
MVSDFKEWINEKLPYFTLLSSQLASVVENMLKQNKIPYLSVESRTKSISSIEEKIKRKNYKNPKEQLTDISGIRVILYTEDDVQKACEIVKDIFQIDRTNSLDDIKRLSIDKIGYRSTHFVCDIGKMRSEMKEYNSFSGLKFEIQIRTILQHAWANLTHDRNYKFGGSLPQNIQRKINLYSGMLEVVDMGFSEIIHDIEKYKTSLSNKSASEYTDYSIDSINLVEYLNKLARENDYNLHNLKVEFDNQEVIDELSFFKIFNISELREIIPKNFFENLKKYKIETTYLGVVRDSLIIKDYFKVADIPNRTWTTYTRPEEYQRMRNFFLEYMTETDFDEMMNLLE